MVNEEIKELKELKERDAFLLNDEVEGDKAETLKDIDLIDKLSDKLGAGEVGIAEEKATAKWVEEPEVEPEVWAADEPEIVEVPVAILATHLGIEEQEGSEDPVRMYLHEIGRVPLLRAED
ncbi:MAG: RNA polymerase sigma factor RpoD, partial [Chloroflexi bacterium]|nr:RNA polymerase sigma factor RpoD [Chloroflexota bacterium]